MITPGGGHDARARYEVRLAENLVGAAEIGFIEPNLEFRLDRKSEEDFALRVRFGAESRPPWGSGR